MVKSLNEDIKESEIRKLKKSYSDADVITELADVSIIIDQMAMYYGKEAFLREKERKLVRLNKRLNLNDGQQIP